MTRLRGLQRGPFVPALLVAVGYYLGAKLGFALTLQPIPVSTLWPPNAILLAGLALTPTAWWIHVLSLVFVAHLGVQMGTGVPLGMSLCWFISNSGEAVVGAGVLRYLGDDQPRFDRLRAVIIFTVVAGVLAPFLSSFLDAAFVRLNRWGDAGYWSVWRTRFQSNCLATLTLVPVIVIFVRRLTVVRRVGRARWVEAALGLSALVVVCWLVFVERHPGPDVSPAWLYAPIPLFVAAAIRGGPLGASTAILVCAGIAIWGASHGQGPFVTRSPQSNAVALQLFLVINWVPVMALAAVVREKTAAEQRARDSEQYVGLIVDAAQLGTWDWDLATDSGLLSEGARRMYGIDEARVKTEQLLALIYPDDQQWVREAYREGIAGARTIQAEFRVGAGENQRWLLAKGRTIPDDTGAAVRLIGVVLDMTEVKRAEMELHEQRRELAHLGRIALVGELSIAIAHELNQPLSAILANARTGRRLLSTEVPNLARIGEILDAIANDDLRAAGVIARVRQMLRDQPQTKEALDVNEVVNEVLLVARAEVIWRHVSMATRLEPHLPPVAGDKVQLHQVLVNLIVNACDAMRSMSGTRRLTLTTNLDAQGAIRIAVIDNGSGIAPDQLDRIFEPFVSTKEKGVGLGLSICRSIVTAHEGRLWAENNLDRGSTFYVTLPVIPAGAPPPTSPPHGGTVTGVV
jgi:two-component system, LuxR family, sensor kinase FixL